MSQIIPPHLNGDVPPLNVLKSPPCLQSLSFAALSVNVIYIFLESNISNLFFFCEHLTWFVETSAPLGGKQVVQSGGWNLTVFITTLRKLHHSEASNVRNHLSLKWGKLYNHKSWAIVHAPPPFIIHHKLSIYLVEFIAGKEGVFPLAPPLLGT